MKTNPNFIGTLCMGDEKVARLARLGRVCVKTNPNFIGTLCMGDEKVARLGRVFENQSELHWDTVYENQSELHWDTVYGR